MRLGGKGECAWGVRAVNHPVYHEAARSGCEDARLVSLIDGEFCDHMKIIDTSVRWTEMQEVKEVEMNNLHTKDTCILTGSTSQALAAQIRCSHSSLSSSSRLMHRIHQSAT